VIFAENFGDNCVHMLASSANGCKTLVP